MKNKAVIIFMSISILISVFFHLFKFCQVPPCLNADEAAIGYNAYSVMKTGRDEYGELFPIRFKSFGEYKMPLYIYASIPFIKLFGLNDLSVRLLNIVLGIGFIFLIYFLTHEIFNNRKIAIISSFLISLTPWTYILTRHAHEAVSGSFLMLISWLFLLRYEKKGRFWDFLLTNFFIFISASAYNSTKTFLLFFLFYQIYLILKKRAHLSAFNELTKFFIAITATLSPFAIDFLLGANRVKNLFYINNPGFSLRINEYIGEHPYRLIHNKLFESILEVARRYFTQISTDFFFVNGDKNLRFGFYGISLINPVVFFLLLIGIYYLFRNKVNGKASLIFLLFLSPLTNSLTWQDQSLPRTFFMIFPLIIISAYGLYHWYLNFLKKKMGLSLILAVVYLFFLFSSWDLYFFHYPKKAIVINSWQCGYKELGDYIKENYQRYDKFYITKSNGQPYIYSLFYLGYSPQNYQKQALLSPLDEYGFGQVEGYDKFIFSFIDPKTVSNSVIVGTPHDFQNLSSVNFNQDKIKKIIINNQEVFWLYEN